MGDWAVPPVWGAGSAYDGRPAMAGPLSQMHVPGRGEVPAFSQVSVPLSQPTFFFSDFLSISLQAQ